MVNSSPLRANAIAVSPMDAFVTHRSPTMSVVFVPATTQFVTSYPTVISVFVTSRKKGGVRKITMRSDPIQPSSFEPSTVMQFEPYAKEMLGIVQELVAGMMPDTGETLVSHWFVHHMEPTTRLVTSVNGEFVPPMVNVATS